MAAAKKDFGNINIRPVYDAIAEATADITTQEERQEHTEPRKERVTYTEDEQAEAMATMNTSGKKGMKMPRINMAFTPANYDYIRTMAKVRGENLTEFVNHIIEANAAENADLYKKAVEFRNSL